MADKDASLAIESAMQLLDEETEILQEVDELKPLKWMLRDMSLSLKKFDGEEEDHPEAARWLGSIRDKANEAQNKIDTAVVAYKLLKQRNVFKKILSGRRPVVKQMNQATVEKFQDELTAKSTFLIETMMVNSVLEDIESIEVPMRQQIRRGSQREGILLIIGEESFGETTLAKMVYNDAKIDHLSCREWVNVPPEFPHGSSLWRIFRDTWPSSSLTTKPSMSNLEFEAELYQNTKGKKYLLVMDNQSYCEARDALFSDEPNGSQIGTIRLPGRQSMALQVSQSHSYKTDSQETRRKVVAQAAILNQPAKIEEILSGFLQDSDHEQGILAAYDNLPREVQRCLWYFGALSADFDLPAKRIIQMWAAEGLLNRSSSSKRPEEIGEEHLEELRSRRFIQKNGIDRGNAYMKTYRINSAVWIHNFVSYNCRSEDGVHKFLEEDTTDNTPIKKDIRWLGIHNKSFMKILKEFDKSLHVTSLHCFGNIGEPIPIISAALWVALLHKFPNVKVLNLDSLVLESVPKEVGKLHHLRYLRLRAPNATHLPPSVIRLPFLETLDMRESRLYCMPHEIWKMKRLRHIYLAGFTMPDPHGIKYYKNLWNLQTLSGVHPDKVLKRLMVKAKFPNVTKLRICTLESKAASKFLSSIDHLYHLQSLRVENPTKLPDPNAFPLSLTKLTFLGTKLQLKCIETLEKLPNLRTLKLLGESITGKEIECRVGGFPQLEVFFLIDLVLEKLTRGKGAMRCLKHLFTNKPVNLEILPDDLRQMATLSTNNESNASR